MEKKDLRDLSRLVSHALRHEPAAYGLKLDSEGWVAIDAFIAAMRASSPRWRDVTVADLKAIGGAFEKKRHEIAHGRIRASYGHSVEAALERTASEPPTVLYHGTSPEAAEAIAREGLRPMKRTHVHLSTDLNGAREVGLRKSATPVLLCVRALDAHAQGHRFYRVDGRVWLADAIPPAFLDRIS
jgi:putative RNA 2'-phosphotransferase